MTVKDLRIILSKFADDDSVWVYEPADDNEPYQGIASVEKTEFGEVAIYRE